MPAPFEDLHPERLATTAEDGSRVYIHTAEVRGRFRNLRSIVYDILLVIFLCLPWVRINGNPLLLLDLPNRHFNIFGLTFWGDDAPILFFVIVSFIVTIGLITAIFGRGWCGWACPQTVFIDRFFLRIERWIEGDDAAQRRLEAAPASFGKFIKKSTKWLLFLVASLIITHSFLAYFVGTDKLAQMIVRSPAENPSSFLVILIATAIILFDFGWFREQFCIIACPYGRLQSVLMDEHSLIVAYDEKRGEPRRQKGMDKTQHGDCVNCYRCVQVCPTGIDIRRGVQMECIACTSCIDACDDVMGKIGKPQGLIRYDTEAALEHKKVQQVRTRTIVYFCVILIAVSGLFFVVSRREPIKTSFVHALDNAFQLVHDGHEVINHYKVTFHNHDTHDAKIELDLSESLKKENVALVMPLMPLSVAGGHTVMADLFITFPRKLLNQERPAIPVLIRGRFLSGNVNETVKVLPLVGPEEEHEGQERD